MNKKLLQLAEHRQRLGAQAATQRNVLAQNIEPWRAPLALADRGLAALHFIKRHPALLVSGGILFSALRSGHGGKWLRRGWLAWQIMHKLHSRK